MIRTFCPAAMRPARRPCRAASPETATTAACSGLSPAGLRTSLSSRAAAYSANEPADAEHLVADLEPADVAADRGDGARHVQTGDAALRPAEPETQDSHQVRLAPHQMTRAPVHASRVHLHKDLIGGDDGLVDLSQAQLIGGAVDVLNDRPPGRPGCRQSRPRPGAHRPCRWRLPGFLCG